MRGKNKTLVSPLGQLIGLSVCILAIGIWVYSNLTGNFVGLNIASVNALVIVLLIVGGSLPLAFR
jgi:hypothetical protein